MHNLTKLELDDWLSDIDFLRHYSSYEICDDILTLKSENDIEDLTYSIITTDVVANNCIGYISILNLGKMYLYEGLVLGDEHIDHNSIILGDLRARISESSFDGLVNSIVIGNISVINEKDGGDIYFSNIFVSGIIQISSVKKIDIEIESFFCKSLSIIDAEVSSNFMCRNGICSSFLCINSIVNGLFWLNNVEVYTKLSINNTKFKNQVILHWNPDCEAVPLDKIEIHYVTSGDDFYINNLPLTSEASFAYSDFNSRLSLYSWNNSIKTIFDFKGCSVHDFDSSGTEIIKAKNRETFYFLKSYSIKKNDTINTLKYYTLELEKYIEELPSFNGNKMILLFEKHVSHFGTSVERSLISLIVFNLMIFFFSRLGNFQLSDDFLNCFNDNLTLLLKGVVPRFTGEDITCWEILKSLVNTILLYEVLKSFRKYSRKL